MTYALRKHLNLPESQAEAWENRAIKKKIKGARGEGPSIAEDRKEGNGKPLVAGRNVY